jgi:hypothetical protein
MALVFRLASDMCMEVSSGAKNEYAMVLKGIP